MGRPSKLETDAINAHLAAHGGWAVDGEGLTRTFTFKDFSEALGFVVRVGLAAEKHDHHPDVALSWGKAKVFWTTHDAGGVTQKDLDLATACDTIYLAR